MVPADKLLSFVGFITLTLDGTRAYKETDTDEMSVVNAHLNELPVKFLFVTMKVNTNFLRCIGYMYLSFTQDHIKLDSMQILALVLLLNFLN